MDKTYWNDRGVHQALLDNLQDNYIPLLGKCIDPYLESFRLLANWYYDVYNNGGGNLCRLKELSRGRVVSAEFIQASRDWRKTKGPYKFKGSYVALLEQTMDWLLEKAPEQFRP
jgi:hypothetical protein